MPFDLLEQIETDLLAAGSSEVIALPALADPVADTAPLDEAPAEPALNLMDAATFHGQFCLIHDVMGGMVQMRTGNACPLGDAARADGGRAAADAIYELAQSNPALSRLILSTESTYLGSVMAIGMHGYNCVQIVRASTSPPPVIDHEETQE